LPPQALHTDLLATDALAHDSTQQRQDDGVLSDKALHILKGCFKMCELHRHDDEVWDVAEHIPARSVELARGESTAVMNSAGFTVALTNNSSTTFGHRSGMSTGEQPSRELSMERAARN
jgi:hypothetical protein